MATDREIRRRIRSVGNIEKVTKAMEAVSASKMRRAQAQVEATRPYADKSWEVLTFLARLRQSRTDLQALLQVRPENRIGLIMITSDRGLAGGLNSNLINHTWQYIKKWQEEGKEVTVVTIGKKGRDWMARYGPPLRATFINIGDQPTSAYLANGQHGGADMESVAPIARVAIEDFVTGEVDAVYLAYTDYHNVINYEPVVRKILPVEPGEPSVPMAADYIFEPDAQTVLGQVLYNFTELQILQALYESIASEHAARMVAMRNATDAANDLLGDLTLSYNKARQEKITMELLDIAAGANALAQETA
ncbi:MAG: ATP synthase F1 subunit gamma [Chloroflexota bacterium]|nr:ATP synthase F1 subunit gamma [Chloroflexota bacterium]